MKDTPQDLLKLLKKSSELEEELRKYGPVGDKMIDKLNYEKGYKEGYTAGFKEGKDSELIWPKYASDE